MIRRLLALLLLLASPCFAANQKPIIFNGAYQNLQPADSLWNGTNPFALVSGAVTVGHCALFASANAVGDSGGSCGGAGSSPPYPQGRLTLVSATPVMTSDQTAKSQIFYDCYNGAGVPYYTGVTDATDTIAACEVSLTMATTGTGVTNTAGVFDIWWVHSGASRICVATNGSGGGWASDTAGSNTARGTGYSQVHNTRGYYTNVNAIAHCYNGTTDYGSVAADQATYLGTIYTTAAGQTGMAFQPTGAAGGSNNVLGLYNAYNRVRIVARELDSNGSWAGAANSTWRAADNNNNNRIAVVDGLQQSSILTRFKLLVGPSGSVTAGIGVDLDSTSAAPVSYAGGFSGPPYSSPTAFDSFNPQIGFHFFQAMEVSTSTTTFFANETAPTRAEYRFEVELYM